MCGISGRIGKDVLTKLVDDLYRLEYRGYDSAGVGYISKGAIKTIKVKGKVSKLDSKVKAKADVGIAHTRWATHGKPTRANAHPHVSYGGRWAVVHNGIIDNIDTLKGLLTGVQFTSQTDTELVAHLLEQAGDGINSVARVNKLLKGSYAICAINVAYPDTLFVMKNKSPLYVSSSKGQVIVTSDIITLDSKNYIELNDGEYGYCTSKDSVFYDADGTILDKKCVLNDIKDIVLPKVKFKHHMLNEIYDTPLVIHNLIDYYREHPIKIDISKYDKIKLIGCGTAYHTGLMGAKIIQKMTGIECHAYIASEFVDSSPCVDRKTLCVFISQSGETADTIECMKLVKKRKCKCVLITNKLTSTMAKMANIVLPMQAGVEVAVASTKAYTAGVCVLYIMAHQFRYGSVAKACKQLGKLRVVVAELLSSDEVPDVCKIKKLKQCFFIGRGYDDITAMEGSLKLKEISYINCIAFAAGELKHGTLALIDRKSQVFAISTSKDLHTKLLSSISEIQARGGKVTLLTTVPTDADAIKFSHVDDMLDGLTVMVYLQLLSYYTSVAKGYDPDKPRNLAKSVTVG